MKHIFFTIVLPLCLVQAAVAQQPQQAIDYSTYIRVVAADNIEYAAEKLNVVISDAELSAAKVFNDFTLSATYYDNDDRQMMMGYGAEFELSKNISFGVRRSRIDLAKNEKALNEALLEDYFRNLRATSTAIYVEALKQQELHRLLEDSYENIHQLAQSDSIRFVAGEIAQVDARKSRLEADILHNELVLSEADLYQSFATLGVQMGRSVRDTLYCPTAVMRPLEREFNVDSLLYVAYDNRADLEAAMLNENVAAAALKLAHSERNTDIELSIGANVNSVVRNEIAPAPSFTGITAGIAVPLKFSNFNKGAIRAAQSRQQQAQRQTDQIRLQIEADVMQTYNRYLLLTKQVYHCEQHLLTDARQVLDGMLYSYNRGEVSLLEVLSAQNTYNDVRRQYIELLCSQMLSLIDLELSAGIWDIEL